MDWWRRNDPERAAREARNRISEAKRANDAARREAEAADRRLRIQAMVRQSEEHRQRINEQRASHQNYAQLILLLGYGGYFTLWTQTRDLMSLWLFGWTGSMLGLSLLVFVSWELIKAWFEGRGMNRLALGAISPEDYNAQMLRLNSRWHLVFGASAIAGLAGGLPLLCWYIYTAIRAAAALPVVLPGS